MSSGLPVITLMDFETVVLDRLVLCMAEISGLTTTTVFRLPPITAQAGFPMAYPLVGPMLSAISAPEVGAGRIIQTSQYVLRVLGDPVPSTLDNTATGGAQGQIDIIPFFNRFRSYFIGHPRLQTTTLGGLPGLIQDLQFQHSGVVQRPAPGGVEHFAIDFTLTLQMVAPVTRLA